MPVSLPLLVLVLARGLTRVLAPLGGVDAPSFTFTRRSPPALKFANMTPERRACRNEASCPSALSLSRPPNHDDENDEGKDEEEEAGRDHGETGDDLSDCRAKPTLRSGAETQAVTPLRSSRGTKPQNQSCLGDQLLEPWPCLVDLSLAVAPMSVARSRLDDGEDNIRHRRAVTGPVPLLLTAMA